jgi:hypothetical protein
MSITSYTELKQACADWLNRADLEQQIPDFIKLAEATLNKVLRSSYMVANATASLTGGKAALPSDALEIIYVEVQGLPDSPLEQVTADQLLMLRRARLRSSGTPRFFAVIGRELWVSAIPSSATTLSTSYYQKIPTLSSSNATNWLLGDAPDLYLYTALMHASPFLQDDQRMTLFSNMIVQQVSASVQRDQRLAFSEIKEAGFSLKTPSDKPAAPVIGVGGP